MYLSIIRVDSVKALILVVSNRDVCAWICFSCSPVQIAFLIMFGLVSKTREEKRMKIQSLSSNFDWCVLCFVFFFLKFIKA